MAISSKLKCNSGTVLWGGRWCATVALFSGEGDEPSCTVDHDVITKHKGRGEHDVITKHKGGEGMMKLKNLVYAILQSNPIQQQKTSNFMQELSWTVGSKGLLSTRYTKQGRLTNLNAGATTTQLHEKSLIIQTGQRSCGLPHLRFPSWAPHDLWSTGTALTEGKEEDHKGRWQRDWRLVNQRTYSLEPPSNSHSDTAAGPYWLDLLAVQARKVWFLPTAGLSLALSLPQTVLHKDSSRGHCACLYVNHC